MARVQVRVYTREAYVVLHCSLAALATLFTIIRLGIRWAIQKRFHADDWYALAACVCMIVLACLYSVSSSASYWISNMVASQQHAAKNRLPTPVIDPEELKKQHYMFVLCQTVAANFFWGGLWAGKLSLLNFYRRLMKGDGFMKWWWTVLTICVLTFLAVFLSNYMVCMPFSRRFSPDPKTNCSTPEATVSVIRVVTLATCLDVATDVMIMILPLPLIARLHVSWLQKLGLLIIFCIGSLVVTFAIIRLVAIKPSYEEVRPYLTQDMTIWSSGEVCLACIVISLPVLRGLAKCRGSRRHFVATLNKISTGSGSRGYPNSTGDDALQGPSANGHIRLHDFSESELVKSNTGIDITNRESGSMGAVEEHTVDIDLEHLARPSSQEELRPVPEVHVSGEHGHGKGIASLGRESLTRDL